MKPGTLIVFEHNGQPVCARVREETPLGLHVEWDTLRLRKDQPPLTAYVQEYRLVGDEVQRAHVARTLD